MVQELHVLRCYSCNIFQVQIAKKVKKWQCKICNEKQSVQKVYYQGSGQDCRRQVQHLNFTKHIKDEQESEAVKRIQVIEEDDEEEDEKALTTHSRWTKYLVKSQKEFHDGVGANDTADVVPTDEESEDNEKEEETEEKLFLDLQTSIENDLTAFDQLYVNDDSNNEDNLSNMVMRSHGKRNFNDENTVKSRYESYNEIEFDSHPVLGKRTKFAEECSVRKQNLRDIIIFNRSESGKCSNDYTGRGVLCENDESVMSETNQSLVVHELAFSKPNIRKIKVFESDDDLDDNFDV